MESNYCMCCIIYIHACIVHALVHVYYGVGIYNCMSAAMACILCHKPSFAGHRCVLHPESFNNKEQGEFFCYVCKSPEGPDRLYLCTK